MCAKCSLNVFYVMVVIGEIEDVLLLIDLILAITASSREKGWWGAKKMGRPLDSAGWEPPQDGV
eukprot:1551039-Prorocentrum_lima.AAC.1